MARLGRAIHDFKCECAHICRESAGIISSAAGKLMDGRAKRDHDGREDECPGPETDSRGLGPRIHEFACRERHDSADITALQHMFGKVTQPGARRSFRTIWGE